MHSQAFSRRRSTELYREGTNEIESRVDYCSDHSGERASSCAGPRPVESHRPSAQDHAVDRMLATWI